MSEDKVILPIPFLLDSTSTSTPRNITTNQPISLSKSQISMERSFEDFHLKKGDKQGFWFDNDAKPVKINDITLERIMPKGKRRTNIRNYKHYQGNTVFFCDGRLLTSRSFWAFCISLVLLIGPSILFLISTCPWLWHHISPAIPILFAYLFCLTFASMLKTSWTDPGIIPRNLDLQSLNEYRRESSPDGYGFRYSSMSDGFPLPKEVSIKGVPIRLKYCETCCIYRPPRSSHCRQCDNCVGRKRRPSLYLAE